MNKQALLRTGITLCAVGIASVMAVGPASATGKASVYTGQREAGRVNYWTNTDDFRVSDTSCDGKSVYAQYQRAGASRVTLKNNRGCGTYKDFYRSFTRGQSIKYRVCVDIPAARDICGNWRWDTTG